VAFNPYNLLRFHVVAASDGEYDQHIKHQVKDALLASIAPWLEEARRLVGRHLPDIQAKAAGLLAEVGCDSPVRVELGVYSFPTRVYGQCVVPAGDYHALRVEIGQAQGQNWWCVLFPPLCFLELERDDTARLEYRFAAAELAARLQEETGWTLERVKAIVQSIVPAR